MKETRKNNKMKPIRYGTVNGNEIIFSLPSFSSHGVKCKLDEDGTIKAEYSYYKRTLNDIVAVERVKSAEKYKKNIYLVYLFLAISTLFIAKTLQTYIFSVTMALIIFDGIDQHQIAEFILNVIKTNINPEYRTAKGKHAAMHMGINSFNDLGRVPTLNELKKYSPYSKNCSFCRKDIFPTLVTWILGSLVPNPKDMIAKIITAMIFLAVMIGSVKLSRYLLSKGYEKYIAIYSLRKPKKYELEMVIAALEKIQYVETNAEKFEEICKESGIEFDYVKTQFGYVDSECAESLFI